MEHRFQNRYFHQDVCTFPNNLKQTVDDFFHYLSEHANYWNWTILSGETFQFLRHGYICAVFRAFDHRAMSNKIYYIEASCLGYMS